MVQILDINNIPLKLCSEKQARKLIKKGYAKPYWKKNIFYIKLVLDSSEIKLLSLDPMERKFQKVTLGLDAESKRFNFPINIGKLNSSSLEEELCRFIFEFFTLESWEQSYLDWNINKITKEILQLDGYCKNLQAAFEYDGPQHYQQMAYDRSKNRLLKLQNLDKIKDNNCAINGVKLIRVPFTVEHNNLFTFIKSELIKNNINIIDSVTPSINDVKILITKKINKQLC